MNDDTEHIIDSLRSVDFFSSVSSEQLARLASTAGEVSVAAKTRIIEKGAEAQWLYVLLSGRIQEHDGNRVLATLDAGSVFGEISLFGTLTYPFSVTAIEATKVIKVDAHSLQEDPDTRNRLLVAAVGRLHARMHDLSASMKKLEQELKGSAAELESTTMRLKTTQEQLIHTEKMATLGQMTAGIAHEIKNPLNFVNNFAELSLELVQEARSEILSNGELTAEQKLEELTSIFENIQANAQKIKEHGERADVIIRGMLMHARSSSGEKEKVDLNTMLNKDLHLAYHGWRAHDSTFNVKLEEEYDANLPPVSVFAQDVSRVFINIIHNAMYAAREKQKVVGSGFQGIVSVSTRMEGDSVVIHIRDNGLGIHPTLKARIFEPFFTTKPSGEGTGLGLSMSHDIITNIHEGNLEVESEMDQFTEFIITLPIS